MLKNILLKNVVSHENLKSPIDVYIQNGRIENISTKIDPKANDYIIHADGAILMPSFVDMQVHLRSPGQEEKEDLYSGTKAAAKGGYTHVACMPNTKPRLENESELFQILNSVQQKKTLAHIYPIAAMTKGLEGKQVANFDLYQKMGLIGVTDDGFGVQDDLVMEQIVIEAKKRNLFLFQHCEFDEISAGASFHEGVFTKKLNLKGYPSSAEYKMIERDLSLIRKYRTPYHVLHLSTKEGIDLVKKAKAENLPVTCEVTPHHLLLCDEDIKEPYADYKMNPPLRSFQDKIALQMALSDGTIDIISTDHAPHTVEEKAKFYEFAPFGIIGLEFAWPLLYTHLYLNKIVTLERLIDAFSIRPRKIFNIPSTVIAVGALANLTLIHPQRKKIASKNELCSKSMNSPFLGYELTGWPIATIWDGQITYQDKSYKGNEHE